jgi:hypothetical protein
LAPGFALVSLLAGFAALLTEPGRKAPFSTGRQSAPLMRDLPGPFTAKWLLAVALIICYGFFSFFSGLPVLFVFLVLAAFCCVLAVSIRLGGVVVNGGAINGGRISMTRNVNKFNAKRRRFNPVEIISRKTVSYSFFPVMLPFAVMALALGFAGFARPQPLSSAAMNITSPTFMAPPSGTVTEADFQEHYLFQYAFSLRALGKDYEDNGKPVIAAYELSSNGLLAPAEPAIDEGLQIPDFPLGDLLRGLNTAPPRIVDDGNRGNSAAVNLLFSLLPILFILPEFIYSRKKKRQDKIGARFAGFYR